MTPAYDRVLAALSDVGRIVKQGSRDAMAQCPAHDDRKPSLHVTPIEGQVLLCCLAGCKTDDVLANLGLATRDLFDEREGATYIYDDGRRVHRKPDKTFPQSGNTKGHPVLYRRERVIEAVKQGGIVYVVEGEKDVHAIEHLGGVATTSPMGAANWSKVDPSPLHGGRLIVVADKDDLGRGYVLDVIESLRGKVESLRVVQAAEGKDAADHVAAGHGLDELVPVDLDGSADRLLGQVLKRSELANLPPVSPLVSGLLDYPAAAVLVGGYGIGKTFLALSLACSVATGRSWLGKAVERRRVLLVIGEGGSGLNLRIAAWEQGYNRGTRVSDDDLIVDVQPQTLTNVNVWERITEQCDEHRIGFVLLDTFSSLAPDADETKDAATMVRRMSDLATRIKGTVLLVHHPGWSDATRTRGGYQFEGNPDNVLLLTGAIDEAVMTLTRKKVKDGASGRSYWLRRKTVALTGDLLGETTCLIESIDPSEAGVPMLDRLVVVLTNYGEIGATGPQLAAELGIDDKQRSTFYRALRDAVHSNAIRKEGERRAARYFIADTPRI